MAYRCVVKIGKALLDCWGFAGSAQHSVGVIARLQAHPGVSVGGPGAHNHETFPPGRTLQLVSTTRLSTKNRSDKNYRRGIRMTRQLFRSFVAMVLAGVTTLAPVAPTFGQAQAPAPTPNQAPAAAPAAYPRNPGPTTGSRRQRCRCRSCRFSSRRGGTIRWPPSWFPHVLRPYQQTQVPEPQFTNSPRIDQLIKDGKLMLSLQDAVELALENNLDIQVQRFNPWIAETDILRTMGGGADRGTAASTTLPVAFTDQNATQLRSAGDYGLEHGQQGDPG